MKCRMLYRRCASFFSSLFRRVSHIVSYRAISRVLRSFGLCFVAVLALTFSPLCSSSVSALDVPSGYHIVSNVAGLPYYNIRYGKDGAVWQSCVQGGTGVGSLGPQTSPWMTFDIFDGASCNTYFYLPANGIIDFQIRTRDMTFMSAGFVTADSRFMSVEIDPLYQSGNENIYSLRFWNPGGAVNQFFLKFYVKFYLGSVNSTVEPLSVNVYAPDNPLDYSGTLNSLNSGVQSVISGLGGVQDSVNSAADQAHQDSQAEIEAINEQTQQQEDQYNQEKEEESQREDEMDGQASQAESMFSFTFLNPFIGIFELFNDSGCVSIPTIAGMVGSDETTYCPWFDSSVRNILTPVFGLSSMILLFGFAVRWLGSGGDAVTVNSKTWKDGGF